MLKVALRAGFFLGQLPVVRNFVSNGAKSP